ncbi:DNA polymerase III subunit alpha [Nisaea acidiphila]|uniref:DNA polymerase III subunit alpha n=1 Tax=Nisaea acidiphila TaxID=1862145 RepID=A0A9J7AU83_9PROT|nr:DNA polymerase III subunit alpha [Nisaea acidiphila]UUX50386.1 DNA polymerase III subunit alpha [Nisaea acidiphila]
MTHADFVHLRVHSAYSLAEGAIKGKELVSLAVKHRMPAAAMTDSGNLFGALEFAVTASGSGVQPIVGVQLALRREESEPRGALKVVGGTAHTPNQTDQIVLLAQTETGYRNLMELVSRSYTLTDPGESPRVPFEDLEGRSEGLIALTGGPSGKIGRLLLENRPEEAETALLDLKALFGDRLYVEIQRHFLDSERRSEAGFLDLAYKHDVPLVATNECYFATEEMYEAHDALLCIAERTTIGNANRRRVTPHHRFKSAEEMRELFSDLPEAVDNTLVIAQRCSYMVQTVAPILPPFDTAEGRNEAEELRAQAEEGLKKRLEAHVFTEGMDEAARAEAAKPYEERLDFELGVIEQMGFPGYFLIVADFIGWAKDRNIPVGPGRGSGAGSLVAYSLTITDLDPLRWGLLFERFLNPERVSMPDFDIDFCQDRRGEVIDYVQKRYGRDRVAQIITFGKLQARAALRDVGRVREMPYGQVDRICKLVPNNPANPVTLAEALEVEPELRKQRDEDEEVGDLIRISLQLEGLFRNASTHAAGVVIGDRPLHELVALYRDPNSDMPATQFNMKWVEQAGLVKFDFLGLKTLSVLQNAVDLLKRRGIELDLSQVPLDDKPTYEMLGRAESTGVFQLESTGMRDVLRRMKPDRFEDIIALVALYRPGPMANIPKYIACKHGEEQPDYMHPVLEPVLKETFGIMIYQEQVQQAAQRLSGYTLGGADLLRRAMGKKIKEEMDAQRETFVKGAVEQKVKAEKASEIFDQIAAFAGYGFNKSHAAAYALVAYHTAYLKANYPVEFLAASMTYDMNNTDKLNVFRQEIQRLGIRLLGPDINKSFVDFVPEETPEGDLAIRYALAAIKNVGENAMEALIAERSEKGPYKTIGEFAGRIDGTVVNKRLMENLVRAGAFDCMTQNRGQLFESVEKILRHANAASAERSSDQVSLFGGPSGTPEPEIALADRLDWPAMERLKEEFDAIGFYLSAHPLDAYGASLERLGVVRSDQIVATVKEKGGSTRINIAGIVVGSRIRTSSRGNRYAFVQLTDQAGVTEVTVFSEVLATSRDLLEAGQSVLVKADAKIEDEGIRLTVSRLEALDKAVSGTAAGLKIYLRDPGPIPHISEMIAKEKPGRGKIKLVVDTDDEEVELALGRTYNISPDFRAAVKSLPGIVDARDI